MDADIDIYGMSESEWIKTGSLSMSTEMDEDIILSLEFFTLRLPKAKLFLNISNSFVK